MSSLLTPGQRRKIQRQERNDRKAAYYRDRAADYRNQAAEARYRNATKAADKLDRAAQADEDRSARLLGY